MCQFCSEKSGNHLHWCPNHPNNTTSNTTSQQGKTAQSENSEQYTLTNEVRKEVEPVNPIPYVCPVCSGKGLVPNGFYDTTTSYSLSTSTSPETCKSCRGTGIVWS